VKNISDFGFVVLEISPTYPEDSGEYTCRAVNSVGEAVTSTKLTCNSRPGIISASQLPTERVAGAATRIAEIEAPRPAPEDRPDAAHGAPKFTSQLQVGEPFKTTVTQFAYSRVSLICSKGRWPTWKCKLSQLLIPVSELNGSITGLQSDTPAE
jgi:hypothetical protein